MPEYIKEYMASISGKSHITRYNYIAFLTPCLKTLTGDEEIPIEKVQKITTVQLQKYMNDMKYRIVDGKQVKLSSNTLATRWSILSSFYKFLTAYGYIEKDLFTNYIERPQIKNDNEVVALNEKEIKMLIENVKSKAKGSMRYRDISIIMLALTTGLREAAITEINVEDIDFENGSIKTTNKGEKTWNVYPGETTMNMLDLWYGKRWSMMGGLEDISKSSSGTFFINNRRERLNPAGIWYILSKYTDIFDKRITPHKLRATCATNLYNKTKDIMLVAETLGHSDIKVTKRYTKIDEETKRTAGNIMNDLL